MLSARIARRPPETEEAYAEQPRRGEQADQYRAFDDRLHEPYRLESAPLLARLREQPPARAAGVTLSGSGPSVVVWAAEEAVADVVAELARVLPPETTVLPLRVAQTGATLE